MLNLYTIIVSYNGVKWIEPCLESLLASTVDTSIIVVDNASSDATVSIIKEKFPAVTLLLQHENLGFGKANNIGLSYALKQAADYVFLLNQDTHIAAGTLEQLVSLSKKHPAYAVLSPVQCNWEGTKLEYYFSKFVAANQNFYSDCILKKPLQAIYDVPFVNAAAWLIPSRILDTLGGFDPIFKHYGEDNNYCQRLAYHGFKVGVVPNTYIYHDSVIRKEPENYLFSKAYWHHEVKNLQIKYADINTAYSNKDFNQVKKHMFKLILISLFKLKFKYLRGYLKKYKIFEDAFKAIIKSRNKNRQAGAHYLDI